MKFASSQNVFSFFNSIIVQTHGLRKGGRPRETSASEKEERRKEQKRKVTRSVRMKEMKRRKRKKNQKVLIDKFLVFSLSHQSLLTVATFTNLSHFILRVFKFLSIF